MSNSRQTSKRIETDVIQAMLEVVRMSNSRQTSKRIETIVALNELAGTMVELETNLEED